MYATNKIKPVRKFVGNFRPLSNRFRGFPAFTTIQGSLLSNGVETFHPACKCRHGPSRVLFIFCLLLASLICQVGFTNTANAATYYLDDANGLDTNPGTGAEPWLTIGKAQTLASEGDTIYIRDGSYGTFTDRTTVRTNWVTYIAETGHTPIFTYILLGQWDGPYNKYLKFDGITVAGGPNPGETANHGVSCVAANYLQFLNMHIYGTEDFYPYGLSSGIWLRGADEVIIQNCEIHKFTNGIRGYSHATITQTDILVDDCNLYDSFWGIVAYGDRWTISDNEIHDSIDGINVICRDTIIEDNYIHDADITTEPDFHGDDIQLYSNSQYLRECKNVTIRNNICNSGARHGISARGANADDTIDNITIENNLVYDHYSVDVQLSWVDGLVVRGNTILDGALEAGPTCNDVSVSGNIVYQLSLMNAGDEDDYLRVIYNDYNIMWSWWSTCPTLVAGTHSIDYSQDDELYQDNFVNYGANNFQLVQNADAVDYVPLDKTTNSDLKELERYNVVSQGSETDYADAGCYEYVTSDPNNDPVLQGIGDKSVDEGQELSLTISATDPNGDTITYSATGTAISAGADFNDQTLTFSWTPSYDQADTYPVTFIASDGTASDSETITITVNNVNRPPVFWIIGDKSVNENSTLSFSVSATDPDGDTISYSLEGLPTGAVFGSQTFTWTPDYSQAGTYSVTFIASDGEDQDSEPITITVINVNRPPVLSSIGNKSVYAGDLLTFTLNATDPDGETITYSVDSLPSGAAFASQTFNWTPDGSQTGSYDVTFTASDGQGGQDYEKITITVTADTSAPTVINLSPQADSIQAPLNTLIILHVVDAGKGVDANSVEIEVNDNTVYSGNTTTHSSAYGKCYRTGTKADYTFIYQSNEIFDFDQLINVTVNATDLAGTAMAEYSYSFTTEMRSFGENKKVNSDTLSSNGRPVTVRDSSGNIWTAWHTGTTGSRDICIGKITAEAESFSNITQIRDNTTDQCNPAIAVDSDDKLYVAWQDNRNGNWDIYVSTSSDGINWSAEQTAAADPNDNQTNPAIVIDSSNNVYVVWEDDRNDNQDIYIATSNNSFVSKTVSQITSDTSDQSEPAIAADSANTIYVVWTDTRNSKNDIYGAASNNGPWTNIPIVNTEDSQSSPAIATEAVGSILHLVWVDDRDGENDIYYAQTSSGLPASPLAGSSIIDDTTSAGQKRPVIAVSGSTTDSDLQVFACWQDERDADDDLYLVEISSGSGTNVFVGDNSTNSDQTGPAIGLDGDGQPYLVWTDSRNTNTDIYYAGSTFIEPDTLASADVSISAGATIGTNPAISIDDVSVVVPAGAYPCDITISISKINNPLAFTMQCLGAYDFGPSNIEFTQPVTITIPYNFTGSEDSALAYWYNSLTDELSQQGITDVTTITVSSTVHALRFNTTHFTPFYVFLGSAAASSVAGGGGGGGCSMSPDCQASAAELLLPYIGLTMAMVALKLRDRRKRKARNITKSGC